MPAYGYYPVPNQGAMPTRSFWSVPPVSWVSPGHPAPSATATTTATGAELTPDDAESVAEVLDFWFGDGRLVEPAIKYDVWFKGGEAIDEAIKSKFGGAVSAALAGGLASWESNDAGRVAKLLVLDQFTRNMFRGSAQAFAGDSIALQLANDAVADGLVDRVHPVVAGFVLLPFEHSESIEDQGVMEEQTERLVERAKKDAHPDEVVSLCENYLQYAIDHGDIVRRFGRYPHRNKVLGRENTPEEDEYLKDAETFGQ